MAVANCLPVGGWALILAWPVLVVHRWAVGRSVGNGRPHLFTQRVLMHDLGHGNQRNEPYRSWVGRGFCIFMRNFAQKQNEQSMIKAQHLFSFFLIYILYVFIFYFGSFVHVGRSCNRFDFFLCCSGLCTFV